MLTLPLVALGLATIGAYAGPAVRSAGNLEVSLSTPADKVTSVSDLRVITTVKNTCNENLKIFKFGTVLDEVYPTRSFIVRKDGKEILSTGVADPGTTNHLSGDYWAVIPAGGTAISVHDVSRLYEFSASVPGTFTFDLTSDFQITRPDGTTHTETVNARSVSITVTKGVPKRELNLGKRVENLCPDRHKASFIEDSFLEAESLFRNAILHISIREDDDPTFKTYFGSNSPKVVLSKFQDIANMNKDRIYVNCQDPRRCEGEDAYINPPRDGQFYFCDPFFNQRPLTSICDKRDDDLLHFRGSTTLRQLTSGILSTDGGKNSCSAVHTYPDGLKIQLRVAFQCFAVQIYRESACG